MRVRLANPGSKRYRYADIAPGDKVRLCVWGKGVFCAVVSKVEAEKISVRGERLGELPIRGRFNFPLDSLCYLEKVKGA